MKQKLCTLTSTEAAAVAGVSPILTRMEVYQRKRGILPEPDWKSSAGDPCSTCFWSSRRKRIMAEAYRKMTGFSVKKVTKTIVSPQNPRFIGHIDYAVQEKEGKTIPLVCCFQPLFGEKEAETIPEYRMLELQWKLSLLPSASVLDLLILTGDSQLQLLRIARDEKLIRRLRKTADAFLRNHVDKGIPPSPRKASEVRLLYPENTLKKKEIRQEDLDAVKRYCHLREEISGLTEEMEAIREKLILQIGNAEGLYRNGEKIVTFRSTRNGQRQLKIREVPKNE